MTAVSEFATAVVRERIEATEALLADVVCATPVEHLWRLAIIETDSLIRGLGLRSNPRSNAIFVEFELPTVCSRIPDIIGGIVYDSTPPAEMLALRNAELKRRAA